MWSKRLNSASMLVMPLLPISLVLFLLYPVPAIAAGFQDVMVPDPGHAAVEVGIWYPSAAAVADEDIELSEQSVARNGRVMPGLHPLVVISHGQSGSLASHYDTALALAAAGYVVAAPTHTGDNWRDQSNALNIMDRPRQISRVIDYMLADWPGRASIDPSKIGMFGFSAGGFTSLVSIGGRPDLTRVGPYCAAHPAQYTCILVVSRAGYAPKEAIAAVADKRIKAAVVAAPAVAFAFTEAGLHDVTVPVQLWRADADMLLPAPDYGDMIRTLLPVAPDFRTVPDAGHFDFLAPCSDALARMAPMICLEMPGFDRTAFHRHMNGTVVAFFDRTLGRP